MQLTYVETQEGSNWNMPVKKTTSHQYTFSKITRATYVMPKAMQPNYFIALGGLCRGNILTQRAFLRIIKCGENRIYVCKVGALCLLVYVQEMYSFYWNEIQNTTKKSHDTFLSPSWTDKQNKRVKKVFCWQYNFKATLIGAY